jgi:alpha-D-xyloside xylohydrolase
MVVQVPLNRMPLYTRLGTILPMIPDDVMTLVPANDFANRNVKSLDERRVYEIYGGVGKTSLRDFEDRTIERDGLTLTISGKPAHVILRWRVGVPRSIVYGGRTLPILLGTAGEGTFEFDLRDPVTVRWQ